MLRGLFNKLNERLGQQIQQVFTRRSVDEELFEDLEEALITGDVSVPTATKLVDGLRDASRRQRLQDAEAVQAQLKRQIADLLRHEDSTLHFAAAPPTVYLVVGVNGTGKTTTIAKLAHLLQTEGHRVMLAAADTFRAAAIDQLDLWAGRVGAEIIKHRENADPAAVVFDAIQAAQARRRDVVIADTAGRLHTKSNLMEELKKISRVVERATGHPPDETLLVLDGTVGQNALSQAKSFMEAVALTGLVVTKLDGTAKGGSVLSLREELGLPIKLVGVGEKLDDLFPFIPEAYAEALFGE